MWLQINGTRVGCLNNKKGQKVYWYTEALVEISNSKNDPSHWSLFFPIKRVFEVFNGDCLLRIVSEYLPEVIQCRHQFAFPSLSFYMFHE